MSLELSRSLAQALRLLNVADAMATVWMVKTAGLAAEANPLMAQVIATLGPVGFVLLKMALVTIGSLVLSERGGKLGLWFLGVLVFVYTSTIALHASWMVMEMS